MTADVELLPPPEKVEVDKHLPTGVRIYAYDADTLRDYARANVLHHTAAQAAEIESLRAKWIRAEDRLAACDSDLLTMQLRAERMAEALREAKACINSMNYPGVIDMIDALLRDQEEGK